MKRYALYGELNNSPISMKSNKISDIYRVIQQLDQYTEVISWYVLCKVNKHGYERLIDEKTIRGATCQS